MRILLVTGDQPIERELARRLELSGHELTRLPVGGEDLLSTIDQGTRFHAAVLEQAALGKGWPRQVRQLRRRAPYLPAIVLLAPGGEQAWRHAFQAGAFEALAPQSPLEAILEALSRALSYSAGRPLPEAAKSRGVGTPAFSADSETAPPVPVGASQR